MKIVFSDQRYLARAEAAEFLSERGYKTAKATLAKLAVIGGGPPFTSWGRLPLYRPTDLLAWAETRCSGLRRSTSDRGSTADRRTKNVVASEPNASVFDPPYPPSCEIGEVDSEADNARDKNGQFSEHKKSPNRAEANQ